MVEIKEIRKNLYRISVPLAGNPLRVLNSYYIKGDDKELVIDTGFHTDECYEALEEGLTQLGSNREIRDVLGTHIHSDHIGLAHLIKGQNRTVFLSRPDFEYMRAMIYNQAEKGKEQRAIQEGFKKEWLIENARINDAWKYDIGYQPDSIFTCVEDGEKITYGDYTLQVVLSPGHTPGQMMLWDEEHKIMFTGDHVLFDITPNITDFNGIEDSLGNYLESLKKAYEFPVEIALPGHRESGDYHKRIEELLVHHDKRIQQALNIIEETPGLCAIEITQRMSWKIRAKNWDDFPIPQKWYATGECLSHLDYLLARGLIKRELKDGLFRYTALTMAKAQNI